MPLYSDESAFEELRRLAQHLDIQLGVEKRKLILAGNEKLTLATDARGWRDWMTGVETRLKDVPDQPIFLDGYHLVPPRSGLTDER